MLHYYFGTNTYLKIPMVKGLSLITFGVGPEGKLLGHETKIDNIDGL